jgi:ADP-heptose:LPS heptosyltransferase
MASTIHWACRFYRGSRPCKFNKLDGSECASCRHVSLWDERILIVKLDALGDVLRTASLLPAIVRKHRSPYVTWVTRPQAVEMVSMMADVDEVIPLDDDGRVRVATGSWDHVYSLSNDFTSAGLATLAAPRHAPVGYSLRNGAIHPSNDAALRWLEMASFDRLKRANTRSYHEIMLDIVDGDRAFAPPRLNVPAALTAEARQRLRALFPGSARPVVAINIGAGERWPKKMLSADQIAQFATMMVAQADIDIVLLGSVQESAKAEQVTRQCPTDRIRAALTPDSIGAFAALMAEADALLCGDTLALHVATAVGVPTVCVVGPTSSAELAGFDGLVVKTSVAGLDCLGCYGDCTKADNCMTLFKVEQLVDLVRRQLGR